MSSQGLVWSSRSDDVSSLLQREWLITNGLGGYASSTLAHVPARKYHGLFVPNLNVPRGRHVLIARCEERLQVGSQSVQFGGAESSSSKVGGDDIRFLREFRLDRGVAEWMFNIDGHVIEKTIVMPHHQNSVCVRYRLVRGGPIDLSLRPYLAMRRHDIAPHLHSPESILVESIQAGLEITLAESGLSLRMRMTASDAVFEKEHGDDADFIHRTDQDRGETHAGRAFSVGEYRARLSTEHDIAFIASTHIWERIPHDADAMIRAEHKRVDRLISLAPVIEDTFSRQLAIAADQFVVLPGSRQEEAMLAQAEGAEVRTVYAGYHWFGDWGRDTMISLEGLTLCTGRQREAGATLRTFARYVRDGLLPNLFPEGEREPLYHTVDATLWYFHAIARYVEVSADRAIIGELFVVLRSIVDHYVRGTRFGIGVDPADGLVRAGAEGYQLTWMDAKVDGWVVTPRRGKPVEIQALWYNALCWMWQWSEELHQPQQMYRDHAQRVRQSFNRRYWNDLTGCLFDVIDGPDGDDTSIRPNQVFALSLSHPVLEPERWAPMIQTVRRELLTPLGLRTLSSTHPDYRKLYRGTLHERDAAYHQGTVWPWLIGHFIDALLKVDPDRKRARALLAAFPEHLQDAGMGSISEVFDGEAPHRPGGCIAQAWSVAEVLRAWLNTAAPH